VKFSNEEESVDRTDYSGWFDFFSRSKKNSEKSKFNFSFDCISHTVLILIIDSVLAAYFLNFLKILTVIRPYYGVEYSSHNSRGDVDEAHNLLR
jgi:hypothetical protein